MSLNAAGAARGLQACAFALFVLTLTASPVLGAINGSVNPTSARPGDWVEVTTDAIANPNAYALFAEAGPAPLFLQPADPNSPGNACDLRVGDLTWAGGVGRARFQVPTLQPGSYWVLMTVQGGCWRFGDATGILTLAVLPALPATAPGLPLPPVLVAIGALTAALAVALALIRRRRGSRSDDIPAR
jgi:hypothetical protein